MLKPSLEAHESVSDVFEQLLRTPLRETREWLKKSNATNDGDAEWVMAIDPCHHPLLRWREMCMQV